MYGLALILFLSIMGGAIAFGGDKLGSKIGKKRLSIFGLRPKHTSILVTIITGALTVALTMGILTFVSRDVRTALFGMEQLQQELAFLSEEVREKNSELERSQKSLAKQMVEYAKLDEQIRTTTQELSRMQSEVELMTAELDSVTAERDRAAADLARALSDYGAAQDQITLLETTKAELDSKVVDLTKSKDALESDIVRLNEVTERLTAGLQNVREGAIIYQNGEVLSTFVIKHGLPREEANQTLQGVLYQINQGILAKLQIKEQNLEVLWIPQNEYIAILDQVVKSEHDSVVRIMAAGNIVYGEAVVSHIEAYPNLLVYPKGTAVYEQEVAVGQWRSEEEAVLHFLSKVNENAMERGILYDPLQGTVGVISGSELYDTIDRLRKVDGTAYLKAVARQDTYTVGPLLIDIKVGSAN